MVKNKESKAKTTQNASRVGDMKMNRSLSVTRGPRYSWAKDDHD